MIVDSDIIIDYLKGVPAAVRFVNELDDAGEELMTTCVNAAEVWRGALRTPSHKDRAAAHEVLAAFKQIPFGPRSARRYGDLMAGLDRAGASVTVPDGMIAAVALENGGRLATRNLRDFGRIPNLEVMRPSAEPSNHPPS